MRDVQDFPVGGEDDLFQVATEERKGTDALNLYKGTFGSLKEDKFFQHLPYVYRETFTMRREALHDLPVH